MTGDEIRQSFLDYFREKGHKIMASSSLIPHGDPTLLLTSAGMVQFKPYFMGQAKPPAARMASSQKCFRATDIECVGDISHLTFFEMLGNFSIGDYFKEGAVSLALEYVLQRLGLDKERLWITIFLDDDKAFDIWRKNGIDAERIMRFGEKDNFWGPAGDSGPCGPCSEIHYDFGEGFGCGKPDCGPNCECGRFCEIWNLVFVQYQQDRQGKRTPLARGHIDTGMGLERMAAVLQGKTSVYETDFFMPLLAVVEELSGKKYGADETTDNAMRIVAEHGRSITFLTADGVMPDNDGRGYVLRRLLRRAALFGRGLGLDKPFLSELAEVTVEQMGGVYPELVKRQSFIIKVIESEEMRFGETLSTGLEMLDDIIAQASSQVRNKISGKKAFKLYDTYGFPIELTCEIASKQGFPVDMQGFEVEMAGQREKAKTGRLRCANCGKRLKNNDEVCPNCGSTEKTYGVIHFSVEAEANIGLKAVASVSHKTGRNTKFIGYKDISGKSRICGILVDNKPADSIKEGQQGSLILETTPFYAEKGGQVGDNGEIVTKTGSFTVDDTVQQQGVIIHCGKAVSGSLTLGDEVEARVEEERRLDIARNHTATHLLHYALRKVLGEHVQQRGSLVAADHLRFDFSHLAAMTPQEIEEVQVIVNAEIRRNLPVYDAEIAYKQAIKEGAIALFDEKYGDMVRVLKIGKPSISTELCGGTHVSASGDIGFFQLTTESSIGSGLRRIEAVSGRGAEQSVRQKIDTLQDELVAARRELEEEKKKTAEIERRLAAEQAESLLEQVETISGIRVLSVMVPAVRMEILREMTDVVRDRLGSGIVVLGTVHQGKPSFIAAVTPDLVKKGYHAGNIIKKITAIAGGGGGGKPDLAQGGGKDKNKLDAALAAVKNLI
ncbi:alanine--tRNA ligase [Chloroflexota bacterium]